MLFSALDNVKVIGDRIRLYDEQGEIVIEDEFDRSYYEGDVYFVVDVVHINKDKGEGMDSLGFCTVRVS